MSVSEGEGVSFLVPVRDGDRTLPEVLAALLSEAASTPFELIVIDDGSSDGSAALLAAVPDSVPLRVLQGSRKGPAAALNQGLAAARFEVVAQLDQDVVVQPGWLQRLMSTLAGEPRLAAVQGYYLTAKDDPLVARVMGLDLEQRYAAIAGEAMDHVCTGNTVYRADALRAVGGFDESFGYGYDNDLSYRLQAAGWKLAFCREAISIHRWRPTLKSYLVQQYGVGYGRLDLVLRHRHKLGGDVVSGWGMIFHAALTGLACLLVAASGLAAGLHTPWKPWICAAAALLLGLGAERLLAGRAARNRFGDRAGWWFAPFHLLRDLAWASAIFTWTVHRLGGRSRAPEHSMVSMRRRP